MGSSKMNFDEKRQLVHKLSKDSDNAFKKVLQNWTYEEIRQILCAESEKERKYTGLTKDEIINILLKTVLKKNIGDLEVQETNSSSTTRNSKKQRKNLDPSYNVTPSTKTKGNGKGTIYCKNLACQAKLRGDDTYCKRCSCCICHKYDGNKDPSLWLTCNSDPPFDGESCGFSFHLSCALSNEKAGLKEEPRSGADGCFFCVSCGKTNSILECLKKQLIIAKEDRRVDVLCRRLLLAQKLLKGTEKYKKPYEKVEKAVEMLENEFGGPLTGLPTEMRRGIVNRLCSAKDVQDHCSSALELLDGEINKVSTITPQDQEDAATFLNGMSMFTYYSNFSPPPPSLETESNRKGKRVSLETDSDVSKIEKKTCSEEKLLVLIEAVQENLPITPSRSGQINDREDRPENAATMENLGNCSFGFEHCVKIIRQLECSGYVDSNFRQKFLTWYSLRATGQEKHVVKTFIDTFKDDTSALADQLVDTFSDCISRKRPAID